MTAGYGLTKFIVTSAKTKFMIVAGIATIPSRIEQVKKTIESLASQVDWIHLCLNNFIAIPDFLKGEIDGYDNVLCVITQGSDEQKFRQVEGDIYLSCDDDLCYPPNYVQVIKDRLEHYDIISFHGRNFNAFPIQSYYKSAGSKYRCLDKVSSDVYVQVGGTGCMAFKPQKFSVTLADFPSKYMADVHLAIKARKENKRIMCIAHEANWIKYQPVSNTIYDRFRDNDFEHTERINEAFGIKVSS